MCAANLSRLAIALAFAFAFASQLAVAGPPHYRVTDYGTLGGPNSEYWNRGRIINDGGVMLYQGDTAAADVYGLTDDGFVQRGVVVHGTSFEELRTSIGDPEGELSAPVWIADNGLIAGLTTTGQIDETTGFAQFRAVLWRGGQDVSLGDFGGHGSAAFAVNPAGVVVGAALNTVPDDLGGLGLLYPLPTTTQARAFIWRNGVMQDIGTLGGPDASALAVNRIGQVAGNSMLDATVHDATGWPTTHPYLWQNGHMRDVGSLGGTLSLMGPINDPYDGQTLNSRGQIAGASTLTGDANWHAFRWSDGRIEDLGTLGGPNSDSYAINSGGDIVGRADFSMSSIAHHAFLWRNGHMTDLGNLPGCENTTAQSVNDSDDVVGFTSLCGENIPHAWVAQKGGPLVDLNDLIVGDPGMVIMEAWYINNAGAIAAEGLLPSGEAHSVLLTPTSATGPVSHVAMTATPNRHGAAWRRINADELSGVLPARQR